MLNIRRADIREARALAQIHASTFVLPWDQSALRGFLEDKTILPFMAIEPDTQKITGFILIRYVLDEADILTIAVDPSSQRKGVGYALCHASIHYLSVQNIKKVHLEVSSQNEAAIKLYQKLGFVEVGVRPNYYTTDKLGMREDAVRMSLEVSSAFCQFEPATYSMHPF